MKKNILRYYHVTHVYHKWQSCDVWFMRYSKNQNFEKMKKTPGRIIILHVYQKWQSYDAWFLRHWAWNRIFVILNHFFPFYPSNNPKNQNFEKIKVYPGDIIILHLCNKNGSRMIHGSWDIECDRQIFFSFWTIFTLLGGGANNPKN